MKNTKKIQRALTILMAMLLVIMTSAPALASSFKARINSSSARVYNVPSTSSKVYVDGGKNVVVTVTAFANGWARVEYKGHVGYMRVSDLNLVNAPKAYTAKSTTVYRGASTSSGRMGTLSIGTGVYVVSVSGDFYRIQNAARTVTGYVKKDTLTTKSALMSAYKKYLAAKEEANSSSNSGSSSSGNTSSGNTSSGNTSSGTGTATGTTSRIDSVIALAKALNGRPYAANANPPSSFNCSIYVKHCMEIYGYPMKSDAVSQSNDTRYAKITSIGDLKKGDILFFDTDEDGKVDHSAIYIGDNTFWEASQIARKVQSNTLDSWYKEHFCWARRPA